MVPSDPGRPVVLSVPGRPVVPSRSPRASGPPERGRTSRHVAAHQDEWADVIADGILGSVGGVPVVASPMHKQGFDLRTGVCLDDPDMSLPVHELP
ncbi:hypothetical protein GUY60_33580 [Streptomyces sp. YC537]|uniref:Rieske-like [2Fe-2S] domain-containing protein n=1 Tax=Streptomyces boluensis TaxID=1775135 RepID=A0A964V324_9ACTN|nr:nitrite reductase (NAD(P)H) small subunit [Streptomyces boluensis]NBE56280.1 hypothetical protein [Streptomyces boluensis]